MPSPLAAWLLLAAALTLGFEVRAQTTEQDAVARCAALQYSKLPVLKERDLQAGLSVLPDQEDLCAWKGSLPEDLAPFKHIKVWRIEASKQQRSLDIRVCTEAYATWQPILRTYLDDGQCHFHFKETLMDPGLQIGGSVCPHARSAALGELLQPDKAYFLVITADLSTGLSPCGVVRGAVRAQTSYLPMEA